MSSSHGNGQKSALEILQEFSIPLIAGVVVAVIWANISHDSYHHAMEWTPFEHFMHGHLNFHFLMNDILMVLFFGIAAKEITEACLPGGDLNPPKKAVNPLLGTLGGVLGPIATYLVIVAMFGPSEETEMASLAGGWGVPTATDIALAWLVARVVFGPTHPAVSFLLLLAVADDGLGLGIIAVAYPDPNNPTEPMWLGLVAAAMAIAYALRAAKVQNFWLYVLVPGVLSWYGLLSAHLHPALALVPIVPFMPSADHDEGMYAEHGGHHTDTLNRFEHFFKLPVDIGLFGFGLANAGVEFSNVGTATWAVLGGLLIGKTVGIFVFSGVGHMLGFKLPEGMNFRSLLVAGVTAALGLTVALFVAGVAYGDNAGMTGAAKMGALFSAVAAPLVFVLGKVLGVKQTAPAGGGGPAARVEDGSPAGVASIRPAEDAEG